ncbi:MAG: hypothetical protein HDQ88_03885 [Clostridia bacterium]|nr:hypothetical protein [Clostridia bacterium]
MKDMLPIPFIEHIPPYEGAENLCAKMDDIFTKLKDDILSLKYAFDPFACKNAVLKVFADFLAANVKDTDSEDYKRHHIWTAIQDNKMFGTWIQVKNIIDGICGGKSDTDYGSDVVFSQPRDMWALLSPGKTVDEGGVEVSTEETWAVFGLDRTSQQNGEYGIMLEGMPTLFQKGIFNIDVKNDHLTQKQIDQLYEALLPTTPVGMTIKVGYIKEGTTELVPYFTLGGIE